jgi:hypothetical protein
MEDSFLHGCCVDLCGVVLCDFGGFSILNSIVDVDFRTLIPQQMSLPSTL